MSNPKLRLYVCLGCSPMHPSCSPVYPCCDRMYVPRLQRYVPSLQRYVPSLQPCVLQVGALLACEVDLTARNADGHLAYTVADKAHHEVVKQQLQPVRLQL